MVGSHCMEHHQCQQRRTDTATHCHPCDVDGVWSKGANVTLQRQTILRSSNKDVLQLQAGSAERQSSAACGCTLTQGWQYCQQ